MTTAAHDDVADYNTRPLHQPITGHCDCTQ